MTPAARDAVAAVGCDDVATIGNDPHRVCRVPLPGFVVDWIIRRAQRRPYYHTTGYMNRWWFIGGWDRKADGTFDTSKRPSFAARVHQTLRSDADRDLHNHPWGYVTVIMRGGYFEVTEDPFTGGQVRRWYGPGSVLYRPHGFFHRLEIPTGAEAWSLFMTGPKRSSWGFRTAAGFVPWRDYTADSAIRARDDAKRAA